MDGHACADSTADPARAGGMLNQLSGTAAQSVQAGSVGDVHFHTSAFGAPVVIPRQLSSAPLHFTNRERELRELDQALDQPQRRPLMLLVCGPGGIAHVLYGSDVTISDPTPPTVSVEASGLLAGGPRDGSAPVTLTAGDGAGIRRVDLIDVTSPLAPAVVGDEDYGSGGTDAGRTSGTVPNHDGRQEAAGSLGQCRFGHPGPAAVADLAGERGRGDQPTAACHSTGRRRAPAGSGAVPAGGRCGDADQNIGGGAGDSRSADRP